MTVLSVLLNVIICFPKKMLGLDAPGAYAMCACPGHCLPLQRHLLGTLLRTDWQKKRIPLVQKVAEGFLKKLLPQVEYF